MKPGLPSTRLSAACVVGLMALAMALAGCQRSCVTRDRSGYTMTARLLTGSDLAQRQKSLMQEMNVDSGTIETTYRSLLQQDSSVYFVHLSVAVKQEGGLEFAGESSEYSQHLQNMLFGLTDHAFLVDGSGHKNKPLTYNLERNFGLSSVSNVVFVFPRSGGKGQDVKGSRKLTFVINGIGSIAHLERFDFTVRG